MASTCPVAASVWASRSSEESVAQHTPEVHHLAQPRRALPAHAGGDVARVHDGPGVLVALHAGHAARRGDEGLERGALRVARHLAHCRKPGHVGYLVRVPHDGARAVRQHRARELGGSEHARLEVDVAVDEAGGRIASPRVDDLRSCSHAVLGGVFVKPHVGDPSACDRDVHVIDDFARRRRDEARVPDDEVGGQVALRHRDKRLVALPQRRRAETVDHDWPSLEIIITLTSQVSVTPGTAVL